MIQLGGSITHLTKRTVAKLRHFLSPQHHFICIVEKVGKQENLPENMGIIPILKMKKDIVENGGADEFRVIHLRGK